MARKLGFIMYLLFSWNNEKNKEDAEGKIQYFYIYVA